MTKTEACVRKIIFLLSSFRASRKMRRSPRFAHKAPVMQATKSRLRLSFSTIMSMWWVHKFFKRIISSSNFVAVAQLVSSGQLLSFHASTNWSSKIPHEEAFIYDIDVSDSVHIYWRRNSQIKIPSLTQHSPFICYCQSFCYCSFLISKFCFEHSVVSPKKK